MELDHSDKRRLIARYSFFHLVAPDKSPYRKIEAQYAVVLNVLGRNLMGLDFSNRTFVGRALDALDKSMYDDLEQNTPAY